MKKLNALQGMRFVAFGAIFLLHCLSSRFCYAAAWAVSFFFMLSGYLYGMKYAIEPLGTSGAEIIKFTKKRLKKLYPLHVITSLAVLPLLGIASMIANQNWSEIWNLLRTSFLSLTLLQSWSPVDYHGLNGVSWFVSSIVFLYFLTPWLIKLGHLIWDKGKMLGIAIAIILLVAAQYTYSTVAGNLSMEYEIWLYTFPPARLCEYSIGIFLGIWIGHLKEEAKTVPLTDLWMSLVAVLLLAVCFAVQSWNVVLWRSVLWMVPNVFILILMSGENSLWHKILGSKWMVWLGNHVFSMFLIHQVIGRYFEFFTDIWDSSALWKLLYCVIIFVITVLLATLWEFFASDISKRNQ
ncbi:MAG: acyltransferase family protein [Lachnospiraceae bacterium]